MKRGKEVKNQSILYCALSSPMTYGHRQAADGADALEGTYVFPLRIRRICQ